MKSIEDWREAFGKLLQELKECQSEDDLKQIGKKMESYSTQLERLNNDISLAMVATLINSPMPLYTKKELLISDVMDALQMLEGFSVKGEENTE